MYIHIIELQTICEPEGGRRNAFVIMYVDTSIMKRPGERTTLRKAISLPCACANLRRAARVITRLYDAALRPSGLGVAQFTLLQALNTAPGMSQKQLGGVLEIDSTTLTRTLTPLRRAGWLRSSVGDDRRELRLALTAAGKRAYRRACPYWERAQREFVQALGAERWNRLMDLSVRTAGIDLAVKPQSD